MQKREAAFNTTFNHWLKQVYKKTGAYELKQTQTDSIPFSDVKPHQVEALLAVRHGTFVFKIPDAGYQNPYDCYCMHEEPAYVVIYYAKEKFFCLISIDNFVAESKASKRRSLTSARAQEIAVKVIHTRS